MHHYYYETSTGYCFLKICLLYPCIQINTITVHMPVFKYHLITLQNISIITDYHQVQQVVLPRQATC